MAAQPDAWPGTPFTGILIRLCAASIQPHTTGNPTPCHAAAGPQTQLTARPSLRRPVALQPEGEYREYYLPLSKEEIERDLEHLGSLLQVRPLVCWRALLAGL